MTIIKRFAPDDGALDACIDQLVEVLMQLLAEQQDASSPDNLRSGGTRVIHVVGEPSAMTSEPEICK